MQTGITEWHENCNMFFYNVEKVSKMGDCKSESMTIKKVATSAVCNKP